jgi:NDP-sugar pyrophosphorylase family protein
MIRQAAVLCGGLGTRLGPLTAATPKPLLLVAGRPFVDLVLFHLGRCGVRRVVLLAGFAAAAISRYAASTPVRAWFNLDIRVCAEPQPAGTGGAVSRAGELLDDAFLLVNGDSWFDIDFQKLGAALFDHPSATAIVAVRRLPDAARYGVAEAAGEMVPVNDRPYPVARFAERPATPGPGLVSAGAYACRHSFLDVLQPICSLEADVFPVLAAAGRLLAMPLEAYFIDIGVPEAFAQAQRDIASVWAGLDPPVGKPAHATVAPAPRSPAGGWGSS